MNEKCEKLEVQVNELKKELKRFYKDRITKIELDVKKMQDEIKKGKNTKGLTQEEFKEITELKQDMEKIRNECEAAKAERGIINQAVSEVREESEGLKKLWSEVVSARKEAAVFVGDEGISANGKRKMREELAEAVERENRKKDLVIKRVSEGSETEDRVCKRSADCSFRRRTGKI